MRILARVALALVLLLVLAFGALAWLLPRTVQSDAVREQIQRAAREALGRDIRYAKLGVGLLPPSLVVEKPAVLGATEGAPPLVEAQRVALQVALLPLLARTIVVDQLVVQGASLRLVRSAKGIELPWAGRGQAGAAPSSGAGTGFALKALSLRDCALVLEDRSVSPAVTWDLRGLDLRVKGTSLTAPFDVDGSFDLASGGRITVEGNAAASGALDLRVAVGGLALAPFGPYLKAKQPIAGRAKGTVTIVGPAASPQKLHVELEVGDADLPGLLAPEVAVRGALSVKADLSGPLASPQGRFDVDATPAELRYGDAFHKPAGSPATLQGRLVAQPGGGLAIDDLHLRVQNGDLSGKAELGRRNHLMLRAPAFDIGQWRPLVPALDARAVEGPVALGPLDLWTAPLAVEGEIRLDGVTARLSDAGTVELRGTLVGEGDAIRSRDLVLTAAGQKLPVTAEVVGLSGTPRFQIKAQAQKVDANRIVATFTGHGDVLLGALSMNGDVGGPLKGERAFTDALAGVVRFDVTPGELRGISLLEATFRSFNPGGLGGLLRGLAAGGLGQLFGPGLERYYGDSFDTLSGTLDLAEGRARTDDLRLVTAYYEARLSGVIRLADLGLDAHGRLILGQELSQTLAGRVHSSLGSATRLEIPLPSIRGTLTDPKVKADWSFFLSALMSTVPGGNQVDRLLRGIGGGLLGK